METEISGSQTDDRSSKSVVAIIALLTQSVALLGLAISACYFLLDLGLTTIDMSKFVLAMIFIFSTSFGISALKLAYSIYSGTECKKWLRYWAGLSLCYTLIFILLALSNLVSMLSFSFLWTIAMNILLSLVPAILILRFTGLSDSSREYHM